MRICIIGSGYQGLAVAAFLSKKHNVAVLKTEEPDAELLSDCAAYGVKEPESMLLTNIKDALKGAEIIFVCPYVHYDIDLNRYDTHDMEMYLSEIMHYSPEVPVVIRSDVPVGYTSRMKAKYPALNMLFVPDFGREKRALYDTFHPSRLVIGGGKPEERELVYELLGGDCEVVYTDTEEAESVKLFANAYLAMRVAYFNELDTFTELRGLNTGDLIRALSLDPRIGDLYNNPSFGYGGRYLTEGTCRLKHDFADIPERIVDTVEVSNEMRKDHIVDMIMKRAPKVCGIYGMSIKTGSKDFRYSAVDGIIRRLQGKGVRVVIFEPMIDIERFMSSDVIHSFDEFIAVSDVIVANRVDDKIKAYEDKVYTRDLFERD